VIKDPSSDHYHLGTRCAKSHSRPIYGTRYALDGKEQTFTASAYKKLVSKLESGELTAEMLMHEQQLTADELRAFVPIAPPAADAADPDDDGTYGIGGRCRLGLAHLQQVAGEKNSLLSKQQSPPLVIEELLGASLYTSPMYLKYALSTHPLSLPCLCLNVGRTLAPGTMRYCASTRATPFCRGSAKSTSSAYGRTTRRRALSSRSRRTSMLRPFTRSTRA
jgi:hypothetical protein